jgi:NADH dehydrogenase FAD-containing subunit
MDGKLMSDHSTLDVDRQRAIDGPNTQVPRGAKIAMQFGRYTGRAVGALIFATLAVLEPFVQFILMTLATLGMFVTIVFGFLMGAEGFPKWIMLGLSVGCFLLLAAYYGVMSIFGNVSGTRDTR